MNRTQVVKFAFGPTVAALAVVLIFTVYICIRRRRISQEASVSHGRGTESSKRRKYSEEEEEEEDDDVEEDLITFQGGEGLTICDILEAPGEVIGKSKYGTLYKAELLRVNSVKLLRFLRPVCAAAVEEFAEAIEFLGSVRHSNLVPLLGFYAGRRGEKLLVHPFYSSGNLAEFIRDADCVSLKWSVICRISIGIAKGLDHLHTGLQKPVIHGNLKSKNILLDRNYRPYISDFGLHLLLKPASRQQMLDTLANQGYKAPELTKITDATVESDLYSLGVIFLELITGKAPVNERAAPGDEPYSPNYLRKAIIDKRISDLYHPNLLLTREIVDGDQEKEISDLNVTEELILKFFQLAMSCCSPSPSLRPSTKQVLWKLEEIVK